MDGYIIDSRLGLCLLQEFLCVAVAGILVEEVPHQGIPRANNDFIIEHF